MQPDRGPMDVIAHRGASAYAPEHTVAAYDLARSMGATTLELDVRSLADGTLVVVHDATLARTAGDPRAVADLVREDLAGLAAPPLTLDDVLGRHGRDVGYLIELKSPRSQDPARVLAAVERHGLRDRVTLQSFDHAALRRLRRLDATLPLAPLYPERLPQAVVRMAVRRHAAWASAVTLWAGSVARALVEEAHGLGLGVYAYTVDEEAEMLRLAAAGVDGIITDVPDRLAAISRPAPPPALAA
jgi:glycerophosphoryl diester phosphodiesterase